MTNDQTMRSRHQFLPRIENQLFCAGKNGGNVTTSTDGRPLRSGLQVAPAI
nr:hypothetical protein [uncultured bacterium]QLG20685.1 hypothetical protein [uncultured bacterium]